jgi:hypothetical protein
VRFALFMGITAALLLPGHVMGEEMSFIPTVENTEGSLEWDMRRIDTRMTTGFGYYNTSLFQSIERLRLSADGYVYHPLLMTYRVAGALGLDQGYYYTSLANNYGSPHVFDEYDVSTTLLPEMPYNLTLFARRAVEPVSPTDPQSTLSASRGALFRYRQIPFTLNLSAISQSLETSTSTYDSKQYSAGGTYVIGPTTNALNYSQGDSVTSQGTQAVRTASSFNNGIGFKAVSLSSSVGQDRQRQTNPATGSLDTDSSAWSERLHMDLPFNVSVDAQHDYRKDVLTTENLSQTPEPGAFNDTNTDTVSISQLLYRNLRTTLSAYKSSSRTTGGDSDSSQQMLAFSYMRNLPKGGSLNADYSIQDMTFTWTGTPAITNEKHTTVVPGTFVLSSSFADPSTIIVLVTDPATQNLVLLTNNVNYQVLQFGTVVQITILSLPASFVFPPGTAYDFTITYFLLSLEAETETRTNAIHLGLTLFSGLVSPFFGYTTEDITNSSGGSTSKDLVTTTTYGFAARLAPYAMYAEVTDYKSRLSPRRSLDTWAEYRQALTAYTDVMARLSYNETLRPPTELSKEYAERIYILNVSAHKSFPHDNLNLFIGGSYTERRITGISSTSYSIQPSLQWHVGLLDVTASASKTYTASDGINGKQYYEQDTYNLIVSRKLW